MATQKPDLTRVWANGAPPGNVVDPDITTPGKVLAGWQAEVPPFEHFNFLQKWFTQGLAHNNEQGINLWDTNTTYPVDALVKGSDGNVYKCLSEDSGENPLNNITKWVSYEIAAIARNLNVKDSQVIYSTDTVTPIPAYIYSASQQKTYSVPVDAIGETIVSVVGDTLNTNVSTYKLLPPNVAGIALASEWGVVDSLIVDSSTAYQAMLDSGLPIILDVDEMFIDEICHPYEGTVVKGLSPKSLKTTIKLGVGVSINGIDNAVDKTAFFELNNMTYENIAFGGDVTASFLDEDITGDCYYPNLDVRGCTFSWALKSGINNKLLTSNVEFNKFCIPVISGETLNPNYIAYQTLGTLIPYIEETNANRFFKNRISNVPTGGIVVRVELAVLFNAEQNVIQNCAQRPWVLEGVYNFHISDTYYETCTSDFIYHIKGTTKEAQQRCFGVIERERNLGQEIEALALMGVENNIYVSFKNNYHKASGAYYLTKVDDGAGGFTDFDGKIAESKINFLRDAYAGERASNYINNEFAGSLYNEHALTKVDNNKGLQCEYSDGSTWQIFNYYARNDISALTGGSNFGTLFESRPDSHAVIGLDPNDVTDSFSVLSKDVTGATEDYDKILLKITGSSAFCPNVYDITSGSSANVVVLSNGHLVRSTSSRRFKENERNAEIDTNSVLNLTPVLFDYKDRVIKGGCKGEPDENGEHNCRTDEIIKGEKDCISYIAEDSLAFATTDKEGNADGINWNLITISLVEEMKKLKSELETLKSN